jgi:hypothetical protein
MGLKLFLIQPASSTRLGVSSIVRSGVKTDCSTVNWSNLPKSSCSKSWNQNKSKPTAKLQQAIENRGQQIEQLKAQRKAVAKHLLLKNLPEQDRFQQLRAEKKHFLDTIKLIAYRAETALAQLAREQMHRLDDARSLIRQLFRTEIDLIPD